MSGRACRSPATAVRLVHGEADGLPGLVVDRYGDTLSAQFLAAGAERWKSEIADALLAATGVARALRAQRHLGARGAKGFARATGWLRGDGDDAPTELAIREHGWRFALDVAGGHKTGFYLDQRDNRRLFADTVRRFGVERVLNCYCYTGGFSVAALAGGAAHVTGDRFVGTGAERAPTRTSRSTASTPARHRDARRRRQRDAAGAARGRAGASTRSSSTRRSSRRRSPTPSVPRAPTRTSTGSRCCCSRPGGLLFTFSCSGGIEAGLFHKIVAGAGIDASVDGFIHARLGAAPDHPMTMTFPEGEYLKGLVVLKR